MSAKQDYVVVQKGAGQAAAGEWREVTLADVAQVRSGYAFKSADWTSIGIPVVKIANVRGGNLAMEGCAYVSPIVASQAGRFNLQEGDILIALTGYIGGVALVRNRDLPAVLNQRVGLFSVLDESRLDNSFLFQLLRNPGMRESIERLGYGSAQPNVSPTLIHNVTIPLPPLSEQRAIAHVLGTLDNKIELNRRMNETLEEMARALFKSWFVDFEPVRAKMEGRWRRGESFPGLPTEHYDLFPDRLVNSELGEIPEGWAVKALGEVVEFHDSKRVPLNSKQRANRQGSYPYYGAAGIMDYVDDFLFDGIYVLAGEDGSVIDADGHPIVQYVWGQFWANNHAHVLKGKNGIGEEHLNLLLQRQNILPFVTGAVQPKLSQLNLKAIPIVLPGVLVCKAFSDLILSMFAAIRSHSDEALTLAVERDTLLPRLLSGAVGVVL